ncbi:hypothetical protein CROQUDRAFT_88336 [Cronartium quercuum f. sp. fusiforme G11]|uniref:Uncharacterized protein n=1 Tax=Cronartium quercuum f. sp. fusiforme G11 TaxID=708437 RepID=A0A9P6NTG1_9BASI|nr:hypothetical protein CROQUDRAFT_88336 [Cronartium quercuum f. sp. fusiforme G11]
MNGSSLRFINRSVNNDNQVEGQSTNIQPRHMPNCDLSVANLPGVPNKLPLSFLSSAMNVSKMSKLIILYITYFPSPVLNSSNQTRNCLIAITVSNNASHNHSQYSGPLFSRTGFAVLEETGYSSASRILHTVYAVALRTPDTYPKPEVGTRHSVAFDMEVTSSTRSRSRPV